MSQVLQEFKFVTGSDMTWYLSLEEYRTAWNNLKDSYFCSSCLRDEWCCERRA